LSVRDERQHGAQDEVDGGLVVARRVEVEAFDRAAEHLRQDAFEQRLLRGRVEGEHPLRDVASRATSSIRVRSNPSDRNRRSAASQIGACVRLRRHGGASGAAPPARVIFQAHNLHASLTARQNVRMGLEVHGAGDEAAYLRAADHMMGLVGLAERLDYLPGNLSGGQKQRVAAGSSRTSLSDRRGAGPGPRMRADDRISVERQALPDARRSS
jgi:hypothetical protein